MSAIQPVRNIFEGIDSTGGVTVTNVRQGIDLDFEMEKDSFYTHSTTVNPDEVTINKTGKYRMSAMITVETVSSAAGNRGNPIMELQKDTGSGWVTQPDKTEGYIREDATKTLGTSLSGTGVFDLNSGDKIRITIYDSVTNEPDEQTVAYSSRLLLEYIGPQ